MNIREAILKAADHIERNPGEFDFGKVKIPTCGEPGCALGWIAHFYGRERLPSDGRYADWDVLRVTGVLGREDHAHMDCQFYSRLDDLVMGWRRTAVECARAMRLYADKYHPVPIRFPDAPANGVAS